MSMADIMKEVKEDLDETNWFHIIYWYQLPESFMREYAEYMDWDRVLLYQFHLTEDFMREFQI